MDKYHIGTRLRGEPKDYIKSMILQTSRRYANPEIYKKIVPHMTFIRPFTTSDEKELIGRFNNTLSNFTEVPIFYKIIGLDLFEEPERILYASVLPNKGINNIIKNLEDNLEDKIEYLYEKASSPKDKDEINLHFTIAKNIPKNHFLKIRNYLNSRVFAPMELPLQRVYLLKNDLILREYDFALKKNFDRWNALDPLIFKEKTIPAFRKWSGYSKIEY
jgi:2'-5' RNA ligase